jgi:flagellar hook-associated protein 1 FlgK
MAGSDILGIAVSGLIGSQNALDTTAHNISNVNTDGYSRQRVQFAALDPVLFGGQYFGTGVDTQSVARIFDRVAELQLRSTTSKSAELEAFGGLAEQVDQLLGSDTSGLSSAMQQFFDAVQGLTTDPASIAQREVMFNQLSGVSQRFNALYDRLNGLAESVNLEIGSVVSQINTLGGNIAKLNEDIIAARGAGDGPANDLLDRRDQLVKQLSDLVNVSTVEQGDGSLNVFIGNGQALVVGVNSASMGTTASGDRPGQLDIVLQNGSTTVDITANLAGGRLAGLQQFRDELLEPTINRIGKLALGLADSMNRQNALGMDLNGQLGGNLFGDINSTAAQQARITGSTSNTGNLDVQLRIDDPGLLGDDNYRMTFDGVNFNVVNDRTGASVATFAPPGATPATISVASEGFSLVFNGGSAAASDRFFLQPSRYGARDLTRALSDPSGIAAASPIRVDSSTSNTGTGVLAGVTVTDTSTGNIVSGALVPPLQIQFTSATTYDVVDPSGPSVLGSGTFTPNQQNDLLAGAGLALGYEISLKGAPASGDVFDVTYNAGGISDNRNALALAALQTARVMENGSANFQQTYAKALTSVGARTQQVGIEREAAQSLLRQAEARRESISGVNLDEEAANLVRYQQAYQASAQVISVARDLFQTLLQSV